MSPARRLARIDLNSADPETLACFYETALGFERVEAVTSEGDHLGRLFGVPCASMRVVTLRLGQQTVDLTGFHPGGAPYPGEVPGWSPLFQHCAIIVSDMDAAYARLRAEPGWQPISEGGPQRLPEASGGVTAFKFRDPEGHPLELLAFPAGKVPALWTRPEAGDVCLGIDHSAISVADTERSRAFYARFGTSVTTRSNNVGQEQARLDHVEHPDVAVTGLSLPGQAAPHIELLCYRGAFDRTVVPLRSNDIACTRLVLEMRDADALAAACAEHARNLLSEGPVTWPDGRVGALLCDPDGHRLLLRAPPTR